MTHQSPRRSAQRGRGRPARLSRDQILDAAVALVYATPEANPTIQRVADAVGSTKMALYRYFPDRDELLHAVADRITADVPLPKNPDAAWQDELRRWLLTSVESVRPYPHLLPYLASPRRSTWLPSLLRLAEVLRPLALDDEDLAAAIALIGTTIVGLATLAAHEAAARESLPHLQGALAELSPAEYARVGATLEHLLQGTGGLAPIVVTHTIQTIASMAAGPAATRRQPTATAPTAPQTRRA